MATHALIQHGTGPEREGGSSHNLAGQRLGRKGQETRERILLAALRLLEDPNAPQVTLTSVAREASVRLSNLYLYFPDFVELLLAALRRVMDDASDQFTNGLISRWPDNEVGSYSRLFLQGYHRFWKQHARILHLRNTMSDSDPRIMENRQAASLPLMRFLLLQMDAAPDSREIIRLSSMATVTLTGFERIATVVTHPHFRTMALNPHGYIDAAFNEDQLVDDLIIAEARLLELAILDCRALGRA